MQNVCVCNQSKSQPMNGWTLNETHRIVGLHRVSRVYSEDEKIIVTHIQMIKLGETEQSLMSN